MKNSLRLQVIACNPSDSVQVLACTKNSADSVFKRLNEDRV